MRRAMRAYSKRSRRTRRLKQRACLRCNRTFLSEGPHHRLCKRCREALAASPTPPEEYHLGQL
jgi:hypothetical protein